MSPRTRVWVTRTLPGARDTAERLRALGYEPVVQPLLEVRPIAGAMLKAPPADGIAALALTSPNGVAALSGHVPAYAHLPAFAVGDTTATAAREAGFRNVSSASADIHALARLIAAKAPHGTVFAPGAALPAGDLPALLPDRTIIRLPVYETVETQAPIPASVDIALVHSPRAGKALAALLETTPTPMQVVAISEAAAKPLAALGCAHITVADHPDEEAVLRALGNSQSAV